MEENKNEFIDFSADVIAKFNKSKEDIKPIIVKEFGEGVWEELMKLVDDGKGKKVYNVLTNMWFVLPDHKYNIIENPPGWNEFLSVVEI